MLYLQHRKRCNYSHRRFKTGITRAESHPRGSDFNRYFLVCMISMNWNINASISLNQYYPVGQGCKLAESLTHPAYRVWRHFVCLYIPLSNSGPSTLHIVFIGSMKLESVYHWSRCKRRKLALEVTYFVFKFLIVIIE